jgi:hypothetical protein
MTTDPQPAFDEAKDGWLTPHEWREAVLSTVEDNDESDA